MSSDYDDYESSSYNLDDVCERLDRIEETLKDTHSGLVGLVWTALLLIALFVWIPDLWHSKTRYAWSYDVNSDHVTINKRPTDCDFFRAPMGNKGCEYKRQVSSIQVRTDSSGLARGPVREVSYDGGKTWSVDTSVPPTQPLVMISWAKIEEQ